MAHSEECTPSRCALWVGPCKGLTMEVDDDERPERNQVWEVLPTTMPATNVAAATEAAEVNTMSTSTDGAQAGPTGSNKRPVKRHRFLDDDTSDDCQMLDVIPAPEISDIMSGTQATEVDIMTTWVYNAQAGLTVTDTGNQAPIRLPTGGQSLGQARLADTDIDTMFAKWAKNSRFEVTITGESDLTQAFKEIDDGKKQIAEAKQDIKDLKQDVASIKKKSDNYVSKDGCRGLIQSELRVDNGPAQCVMRQTFQTQLQSHTKKATDDIEKLQKRMDSLSLEVKHLPSKKEGPHGQPVRAQQSAAAPVQPSNDKRVAAMEDDNLKLWQLVAELRNSVTSLTVDVSKLRDTVNTVQEENGRLRKTVAKEKKENIELHKTVIRLRSRVSKLELDYTMMDEKLKHM